MGRQLIDENTLIDYEEIVKKDHYMEIAQNLVLVLEIMMKNILLMASEKRGRKGSEKVVNLIYDIN